MREAGERHPDPRPSAFPRPPPTCPSLQEDSTSVALLSALVEAMGHATLTERHGLIWAGIVDALGAPRRLRSAFRAWPDAPYSVCLSQSPRYGRPSRPASRRHASCSMQQ